VKSELIRSSFEEKKEALPQSRLSRESKPQQTLRANQSGINSAAGGKIIDLQ